MDGSQETEKTKIDLEINAKSNQEFLDIAKTLEDLGVWTELASEAFGKLEKKVTNVGKALGGINKEVKTKLENIEGASSPNTTTTNRAVRESINTQKDEIDAVKKNTGAVQNLEASINNLLTRINQKNKSSNEEATTTWVNMMNDPAAVRRRNLRNQFEVQKYESGRFRREDELKYNLLGYRESRERLATSKRGMNPFSARNLTSSYSREFTNRETRSTAWQSIFPKVGSIVSGVLGDKGILNKEGSLGMIPFSGVSRGGLLGSVFSSLSKSIDKLARAGLNAYGSMSKLETSLGVVFGSKAQAGAIFDQIKEYAITSPFGVAQVTEMATLLKQSGIYDSDLMDTLKVIGDLAGGNEDKYRRIANNYAQTLAIGKVTTKDMREFANAGIPIFAAVAEYLGVSRKELSSQIEEGNVTSQVIENVFKKLTSEGGLFYKATEQGAKTYAARKVNFEDTKQLALSEFGEYLYEHTGLVTGVMDIKETVVEDFKEALEAANIRASYKELRAIKEDLARTEELLASGDLAVYDEKLYEQQKETLENTYTTDEELKILNDMFLLQKEQLDTMNPENFSKETAEQRIAFLEEEINKLEASQNAYYDIGYGAEALSAAETRLMYQSELDALNYDMITHLALEDNYDNLYNSALGVAHAMVTIQEQWKKSQDFFDKQAKNNQDSSINMNDRLNEMYKTTEEYKQKQEEEELNFLQKAIETAVSGERFSEGISALRGLSKDELLDAISTYFSPLEEEVFLDGRTFDVSDVYFFDKNLDLVKSVSWNNEADTELKNLEAEISDSIYNKSPSSELLSMLGDFVEKWKGTEAELVNLLFSNLSYTGVDKEKAQAVLDEAKKKKSTADTTPLWARIIGNVFDWDPENLDWTYYHSTDKYNHAYAFDAYMAGNFDYSIDPEAAKRYALGQRGGKFGQTGVKALLSAGGSKYRNNLVLATTEDGSYFTQNFAGSGNESKKIIQYDWNKSFEALKEIALSMTSSLEMTNALSGFYKTEREKITNFLTTGSLSSEDFDKLTSDEYKEAYGYLGEEFEKLVNVLGKELIQNEDGTFSVVEGAGIEAALALEKLLEESEGLTTQFASLKNSVSALKTSTEQTQLKQMAVRTDLFGQGLTQNQRLSLVDSTYTAIQTELEKKGLDFTERQAYISKITDYISAAESGNLDGFSDLEKDFVSAIQSLIEATKENSSALLGFDLAKRLQQPSNYGELSVDKMSIWRSGSFGKVDQFGNTAKEQRILNTFGLQNVAYGELTTALQDPNNKNELSQIQQTVSEKTGLDTVNLGLDELLDKYSLILEASNQFNESMINVGNSIKNTAMTLVSSGIQTTFETIGQSLVTSESASKNLGKAWSDLTKTLASQISTLLITEGLKLAGSGAISGGAEGKKNIAVGLAMVAAGGLGSLVSGIMSANDKSDDADEEVERLNNIKDMLADLLAQARIDAEYYEKNLRHQYAISANEALSSSTKVNDAVITPRGDIISTHPDDWLIATKTPQSLGGAAPVVTITIVNESGASVAIAKTEKTQNGNNIDIKAFVVAAVNEAAADGSLDSGLAAYQQRQQGRFVTY